MRNPDSRWKFNFTPSGYPIFHRIPLHRHLPLCRLPHPCRACPWPRSRSTAPVINHARATPDEDSVRTGCRTAARTSCAPQPCCASVVERPVRAVAPDASTWPPRATSMMPTTRGNRAPLPVAGLHQGASLLLNLLLKVTCYRASWKLSSSISCVPELS
jgi:hypothetical protein